MVSPAFSRSWSITSLGECTEKCDSPSAYRRTFKVPSADRCRPTPGSTHVQKYERAWNGQRVPWRESHLPHPDVLVVQQQGCAHGRVLRRFGGLVGELADLEGPLLEHLGHESTLSDLVR
jgi:hypothetical protein